MVTPLNSCNILKNLFSLKLQRRKKVFKNITFSSMPIIINTIMSTMICTVNSHHAESFAKIGPVVKWCQCAFSLKWQVTLNL
jgi:hypothetical protein